MEVPSVRNAICHDAAANAGGLYVKLNFHCGLIRSPSSLFVGAIMKLIFFLKKTKKKKKPYLIPRRTIYVTHQDVLIVTAHEPDVHTRVGAF